MYTATVAPLGNTTGKARLTVYGVLDDLTTRLSDGAAKTLISTTSPGQNAQLLFNGTAGHGATISVLTRRNWLGKMAGQCSTATVLAPSGKTISQEQFCRGSYKTRLNRLPEGGTYSVILSPDDAAPRAFDVEVVSK
jgi:hypothetical protein